MDRATVSLASAGGPCQLSGKRGKSRLCERKHGPIRFLKLPLEPLTRAPAVIGFCETTSGRMAEGGRRCAFRIGGGSGGVNLNAAKAARLTAPVWRRCCYCCCRQRSRRRVGGRGAQRKRGGFARTRAGGGSGGFCERPLCHRKRNATAAQEQRSSSAAAAQQQRSSARGVLRAPSWSVTPRRLDSESRAAHDATATQ